MKKFLSKLIFSLILASINLNAVDIVIENKTEDAATLILKTKYKRTAPAINSSDPKNITTDIADSKKSSKESEIKISLNQGYKLTILNYVFSEKLQVVQADGTQADLFSSSDADLINSTTDREVQLNYKNKDNLNESNYIYFEIDFNIIKDQDNNFKSELSNVIQKKGRAPNKYYIDILKSIYKIPTVKLPGAADEPTTDFLGRTY